MDRETIESYLREEHPERLAALWRRADEVRREHVGDAVHLRGLIEFSNHCCRNCIYCGVRAGNATVTRYRMSGDEILACAHKAEDLRYGTVVMQSGEDPGVTPDWLADVIRRIKSETDLAVTLSVGEYPDDVLRLWREAGADRYLLRFETSNPAIYAKIHPKRPGGRENRLSMLQTLHEIGYETGSGALIGIPGQTYGDLARDIELFRELDLHMVGVGPFIVHPNTPLASTAPRLMAPQGEQVPNSQLMAYKVIALTRITCPDTNIPSTTAIATLDSVAGRKTGLARGANVIMPNLTPPHYRRFYEIYPAKAGSTETADESHAAAIAHIEGIGRVPAMGRGDSPAYRLDRG